MEERRIAGELDVVGDTDQVIGADQRPVGQRYVDGEDQREEDEDGDEGEGGRDQGDPRAAAFGGQAPSPVPGAGPWPGATARAGGPLPRQHGSPRAYMRHLGLGHDWCFPLGWMTFSPGPAAGAAAGRWPRRPGRPRAGVVAGCTAAMITSPSRR